MKFRAITWADRDGSVCDTVLLFFNESKAMDVCAAHLGGGPETVAFLRLRLANRLKQTATAAQSRMFACEYYAFAASATQVIHFEGDRRLFVYPVG